MKIKAVWKFGKHRGIVEPVTLQSPTKVTKDMTDWGITKVVQFNRLIKGDINKMGTTGIIQLLNFAIPQVANLIVAIKHRDGTQSAVVYLDEADAQFASNQKQIQDWMAARGQANVAAATSTSSATTPIKTT